MTPNDAELDCLDIVIDHFKALVKTTKNPTSIDYLNKFNELSLGQKREILYDWICGQNLAVAESVKAGIPIMVPAFGTFCINSPTIIFNSFKTEIANEFGYSSYKACPKDIKVIVNNLAKERQKERQYEHINNVRELNNNGGIPEIKIAPSFIKKIK